MSTARVCALMCVRACVRVRVCGLDIRSEAGIAKRVTTVSRDKPGYPRIVIIRSLSVLSMFI